MSKKLGAGLIAKNEEAVIETCIKSFIDEVDFICLIDTGSTDKTLTIADDLLSQSGKPYHIETKIFTPFNFADARNVYVDYLDDKVDFVIQFDADDILNSPIRKWMASPYDVFSVNYVTGLNSSHIHYRYWRTKLGIRYAGPCHEYLKVPPDAKHKHLDNVNVIHKPILPEHYQSSAERNLTIFENLINPSPREIFYHANTLRDLNKYDEAIKMYQRYIDTGSKYFIDELMCVYWYKSYLERITGKLDDAQKTINEGLKIDDTFADLWMELYWLSTDRDEKYKCLLMVNSIPYRKRLFNNPCNYQGSDLIRRLLNDN